MTQVYVYYSRYTGDRPVYKFLVVLIMLLETTDQAFIGHIIYFYSITNFARLDILLRGAVTWSFIMQLTLGAFVGAIVKTSFSMRVWRFSQRNYYITGLCLLLTFGHLGLAFAFAVKSFELPSVFAVVDLRILGTVALAVGVLTDIIIAVALCFFLSRLRTGYKQSDTLVNSLVRYAINTGALTSAVSVSTLIMYNLMPHNMIFISTYFVLSKLYAISFMATLNTRRVVRGRGTDRQGSTGRTNNNTNLFPLGTRIPSMAPGEMDDWSPISPVSKDPLSEAYGFNNLHAYSGYTGYTSPAPPKAIKYQPDYQQGYNHEGGYAV